MSIFTSDKLRRVPWRSSSVPRSRQDPDVAAAPAETFQSVVQSDGLAVRDHNQERGWPPGARHQGPDHVKTGLGDSAVATNKSRDQTETSRSRQ